MWDDPEMAGARLAVEVGVAVRDAYPDAFPQLHQALFAARHDDALDIREEDVLRRVLAANGLDPDEVFAIVATRRAPGDVPAGAPRRRWPSTRSSACPP